MIELTHPWFLLLLAALPGLWFAQRRSLADMTASQRRLCLAMRALILALVILALAGIRLLLPAQNLAVVFAVDHSASISNEARQKARDFVASALARQGAQDSAGIVGFAGDAQIWQPPVENLRLAPGWPSPAAPTASDLGRALDFSGAIFPAEKPRRLVLLSDGNDTADEAAASAHEAAENGVEIYTVPLRNPAAPEVLVERVNVPARLKTGEPFDLVATIRSSVETSAQVKLYQNQFLLEERAMTLKPGSNDFRAPNLNAEGTFVSYEVEVVPALDTALENNRAQATATLRGQPRILVVDGDEARARPLAEALRAEKIQVETRGPLGLPKTFEDLQQFDLLTLSDVSALSVPRAQMELYRRWVQDFGGGFLMIGGENSFGVGGYFRTPVEQLLPVRMEHEDRQETPGVALLVVLDRSGSMTAQVQGQTKMSLANQGAVLALNVLQPKDYFGVTAVDTRVHVVAPLAQHGTKGPIEQKIMNITAGGGGIYIYTSLADSFERLRDLPARIKHVILFSDSADAEEKTGGEMGDGARAGGSSLDLASAMLAAKITTSVVALGLETDKDTAFLRQLAERGNGRFYLTSDATTLPQIFSTETMKVAQSSLVEEPFLAIPAARTPLTAGIDWAQSPLLLGYNTTKPKPTAEVLLATERGEPLLATWRYGLGQAAAFTSDAKSRWAAEWLNWPGYGKFWAQV
ncbi:MAG: VWA domain-containing protein, partial [Verrucomicrobiota bacterium]|nr:VWA domain-containing protein [Verrucomicrobiota bacterium]